MIRTSSFGTFGLLSVVVLLAGYGTSVQFDPGILPSGFSDSAFTHIDRLAAMDHRQVGSENDRRTVQYIANQLEEMQIEVEIQEFEFLAFEYSDALFEVNGDRFDIEGIGIDPLGATRWYEGRAFLIDLNDPEVRYQPETTRGKTIITNTPMRQHFGFRRYDPGLIVYVDDDVFQELEQKSQLHISLALEGESRVYRSANVIGRVGHTQSSVQEILVTAHHDTFGRDNPGASDNASGVGVLLELARYFKTIEDDLPCTVKFVAFGGEEVGFLGSRMYIDENTESLRHAQLAFNIDNVGGTNPIYIETTGDVDGVSNTKGISQIPREVNNRSWEGITSTWRSLLSGDVWRTLSAVNHPGWLVDVVDEVVEELGYDVQPTQTMGSDALMFAQAGIVSSGIGIRSAQSHTPLDRPERIIKENLTIAGEIAAHVVLNTMRATR